MDGEILHNRLVATEGTVIRLDERIDAMAAAEQERNSQFTTLEERLSQCLEKLTVIEATMQSSSNNSEQIAEAETVILEAEAREAVAEAEIAEALAETISEAEPVMEAEPEAELSSEEITELEPEPPSAAEESRGTKSTNWLEKFLLVR